MWSCRTRGPWGFQWPEFCSQAMWEEKVWTQSVNVQVKQKSQLTP